MLFTATGQPASPELDRLVQAIDDAFSLRFFEPIGLSPYWGVMFRWPKTDERWERVQKGEIPESEAADMVAQLPPDCPPDQACSIIEKRLRNWGNAGRADIGKWVDKCREANERQAKANIQPLMDYADEVIDANKHTILEEFGKTTARVFMSEKTEERGRKRAKLRGPRE